MTRTMSRIAACAVATCAVALAVPSIASASTVFVNSEKTVEGPFNSCEKPGYNSIQKAIAVNPAKSTIHVCAAKYEEQVVIEKADTIAADAGAELRLPASPSNSTTACDVQKPSYEEQDQIAICTAGKVSITGLTINSKWTGPAECQKRYFGIMAGGKSQVTLAGVKIMYAGSEPINGCQQGVGVLIGHALNGQVARATLSGGDVVQGYQKNGMVVSGPGSSAKISATTVTGAGPQTSLAQNGIQVSEGGKAKITGSTVTGNECNHPVCGPDAQTQTQSAGVLLFEQASGVSVSSSNISQNDIGVYNAAGSESATTSISNNTLEENRFEGIVLEEGAPKINGNKIIGNGKANVGIQLLQFEEDKFGLKATGKADTITGMNKCAVEGYSDNKAGDKLETLSLKGSLGKFSGNAQPLCNNNEGKIVISLN